MSRSKKDSKELMIKFLDTYLKNNCQLVTTCKEVGISDHLVNDNWIHDKRKWEYLDYIGLFLEHKKRLEQLNNEKLEKNLLNMGDKNVVANIFLLKHQWRDKYGEGAQIEVTPSPLWFEKPKEIKPDQSPKQLESGEKS